MKRTILILAAAVLALTACGTMAAVPPGPSIDSYGAGGAAPAQPAPAFAERSLSPSSDAVANSTGGGEQAAIERIVIENAELSVVVKDPKAKMAAVAKLAEDMGGYVVSSQTYQSFSQNGRPVPEANIVFRVPAERLDEALTAIKQDTVEVQSESRTGQDVTKDYVDQQSQLRNLEAAEKQLTTIMEQATKTEDVLNVFNQLTIIRSQIEVVKGQINYYDEASRTSGITVRIVAEETIKPLEVAGWKPQGIARDAIQSLINFFQGFVNFLIWFVLFLLPAGILIFLPLWLIWRGLRALWRRSRAQKSPPPAAPPAA